MKRYVITAYLVFWFMVLGICGTASMVFHCPPVVMRILSNVCAWSPTIVLLAGFRRFSLDESIQSAQVSTYVGSFLFSITTGPTGEESGWRGYVRPYLNRTYTFFKASVLQGLIWAFWHAVLWFVDSDFMGLEMIPYVLSNVVVMTGLCFVMNYFMEKHDNLVYGIVIHFCFNFLYCFLAVDIWFYVILSVVYAAVIAGICCLRHCSRKNEETQVQ